MNRSRFAAGSRAGRPVSARLLAGLLLAGHLATGSLLTSCSTGEPPADAATLRVATFNVSLYRDGAGQLTEDLATGTDPQARDLAAIIRTVRPDILLLNEIDYSVSGRAVELFCDLYLEARDLPGEPIHYPHRFAPPVNTGVPSRLDLDGNGSADDPADAWGFGRYPGQYGLAVVSLLPIDTTAARTFQTLPWHSLPDHVMPPDYYPEDVASALRLSSKTHVDVPVQLADGRTLHLLASHPTPPVFDGPEDRNGRRNHDEIRLWAEYLDNDPNDRDWLRDDAGQAGGLAAGEAFVICGDLNADPNDGDSFRSAIQQLLDHPRVLADPVPSSTGAVTTALSQSAANDTHRGDHAHDTGDFTDDPGPGNMRLDYVLPSRGNGFNITGSGVFWPAPDTPGSDWVDASDHRLVWIDLR